MITSQNLNQRIPPPKVKDEISRLVETFNEMITRLDQSFRQIKQFSSDASHELKTPLTILKGEVEVALRKERTSSEYQKVLTSNLEEVNRMGQIVDDLLLLSRTDSGEIQLNREQINLSQVLKETIPQASLLARHKNLRILAALPEEEVSILGDRLRIRELLLNLIENAIKYTEEGGSIGIHLQRGHSPSVGQGQNEGPHEENGFADSGDGYGNRHCERRPGTNLRSVFQSR
jgi:signal transduction histidine kinase